MGNKKSIPPSLTLSAALKAMTVVVVDPDEYNLKQAVAAQFYAHLGRVTAIWADIDGYLFDLFVFCLVIDRYKASILFERYQTIGSRMIIVDTILEVSMNAAWYRKWAKIYKELERLLPFRNQLAHNPVGKIPELQIDSAPIFRYYSHTHRRKLHKTDNFIANVDDINNHIQKLLLAYNAMSSLGIQKRARRRPSKFETPRFPLELGSKCSQTKKKTRVVRRSPPRSSRA